MAGREGTESGERKRRWRGRETVGGGKQKEKGGEGKEGKGEERERCLGESREAEEAWLFQGTPRGAQLPGSCFQLVGCDLFEG